MWNFIYCFHCKIYHSSTNLHGFVVVREKRSPLVYEDKGSKFGHVIFQEELPIFVFDHCVQAGDRNVVDSQVRLVASTHFEDIFASTRFNNMYNSRSVFFLIETFKHYIA